MHKVLVTLLASLGMAALLGGTALASDGDPSKPTQPQSPPPKIHVVQPGDSLSIIADEEKLDSWRPLWNANADIEHPDLIYAGENLIVPAGPTTDRPLPADVVAPVAAPVRPTGQVSSRSSAANYASGAGGLLARIRQREAGGNYAENTGNGYYGAYQFSLGTWRGVGGSGLPSDASPAEQDMRAQMLYNERGCSPWPNTCY